MAINNEPHSAEAKSWLVPNPRRLQPADGACAAQSPWRFPKLGGTNLPGQWLKYASPLTLGAVLWWLPTPAGLPIQAWHMFAVFVATIAGVVTAPAPMSVVAILGATTATVLDLITFTDVAKATGTELVWLVLLAFFIAKGVIKTGLGRRIALHFMRLFGRRTVGLGYGLAVTELVVAPAMPSITARAGGVMLPITRAICEVLASRPDDATRQRVGSYLILCAFHANIVTAAMFVTAMAGNPVVVNLAADQGVKIGWLDWAMAASVPGLLCLAVVPLVLLWIVKPRVRETPDAITLAQRELSAMGPVSRNEKTMTAVFIGLLGLWVIGEQIGVSATLAAAFGVVLMILGGVITWQDALEEKAAWDTMIWIGLLIMLASKLNEFGMVKWFGGELGPLLQGYPKLLVFVVVCLSYFYARYFFASATAHVTTLFPVCLALLVGVGAPPLASAVVLGSLSSLCGCLTQYAIGSGPVMFSAGYVTQAEWWKAGFLMGLIYIAMWLTVGTLWCTAIGAFR